MKIKMQHWLAVILGIFGFKSLPAQAATDIYLCLDGIEGESSNSKAHAGCIDVLSWSWGMSQSGSTHVGTGGTTGKASFQDLSVTKTVDKSTPALMEKLATGKHIVDGTLEVWVDCCENDRRNIITLLMTEIIVTSLSMGGSPENSSSESLTLNFAKFNYTYTRPDNTTTDSFEFDIQANSQP